ncbi:MAG: aspartate dehydrogenase [Clostridium sp.]|nr:aspartate dehydrogenase [Clostridium sp.]MCM1172921.1 aspartate dehydrogenase [Clostridium sp.]MCM1208589.1 aspartate dehydrogenase [Ruminococcus sp.]
MSIFKKKPTVITYDKENLRPVIRSSICTGERVAGFKDIRTGKFKDIMLIRNDRDLKNFMETYGISDIEKEY